MKFAAKEPKFPWQLGLLGRAQWNPRKDSGFSILLASPGRGPPFPLPTPIAVAAWNTNKISNKKQMLPELNGSPASRPRSTVLCKVLLPETKDTPTGGSGAPASVLLGPRPPTHTQRAPVPQRFSPGQGGWAGGSFQGDSQEGALTLGQGLAAAGGTEPRFMSAFLLTPSLPKGMEGRVSPQGTLLPRTGRLGVSWDLGCPDPGGRGVEGVELGGGAGQEAAATALGVDPPTPSLGPARAEPGAALEPKARQPWVWGPPGSSGPLRGRCCRCCCRSSCSRLPR